MAKILSNQELHKYLYTYYKDTYGELESDHWYEQPAANVWVFERDGRIITLKCHILTGQVKEYIDNI